MLQTLGINCSLVPDPPQKKRSEFFHVQWPVNEADSAFVGYADLLVSVGKSLMTWLDYSDPLMPCYKKFVWYVTLEDLEVFPHRISDLDMDSWLGIDHAWTSSNINGAGCGMPGVGVVQWKRSKDVKQGGGALTGWADRWWEVFLVARVMPQLAGSKSRSFDCVWEETVWAVSRAVD